jgi:hypothetical protein
MRIPSVNVIIQNTGRPRWEPGISGTLKPIGLKQELDLQQHCFIDRVRMMMIIFIIYLLFLLLLFFLLL